MYSAFIFINLFIAGLMILMLFEGRPVRQSLLADKNRTVVSSGRPADGMHSPAVSFIAVHRAVNIYRNSLLWPSRLLRWFTL